MATTGEVFPTSGTNVDRSGATSWTNPGNIVSDDSSATSCTAGSSGSDYLVCSAFGFSIPTGATINGITVRSQMGESSTGSENVSVQIQGVDGSLIGSAKSISVDGTAAIRTWGSSSDVWGTTLTAEDINDADFGCRVWYPTTHTVSADYLTIEIEYTPAAVTLTPGLFTSAQSFYGPTASATYTLSASLFTNTAAFYAPTVTAGAVTLTPALFTNSQSFHAPTLSPGAVTLAPDKFDSAQTFYAPTVSQDAVVLEPELLSNAQTFYGPTLSAVVTLEPGLAANEQEFFEATVSPGAVSLVPPLTVNTASFFAALVTSDAEEGAANYMQFARRRGRR